MSGNVAVTPTDVDVAELQQDMTTIGQAAPGLQARGRHVDASEMVCND